MDFPSPCPKCGKAICRRAYTMSLALGYAEEQYCLNCLAKMHNQNIESMFDFVYGYIQGRDCFKKEWIKMKDKSECPLPNDCVIKKCFVILDLRGVECPLNFVKTKIQLEKMEAGQILEVLLDPGEPIESVPSSILEEGHKIVEIKNLDKYYLVKIQKS